MCISVYQDVGCEEYVSFENTQYCVSLFEKLKKNFNM